MKTDLRHPLRGSRTPAPGPEDRLEIVDIEVDGDAEGTGGDSGPVLSKPSVLAGVLAAACVYEVLAEAVNVILDDEYLPSLSGLLRRMTLRRALARVAAPPVALAGGMAAGFVVYVVGRSLGRSAIGPARP
jgi:hypothetical protein